MAWSMFMPGPIGPWPEPGRRHGPIPLVGLGLGRCDSQGRAKAHHQMDTCVEIGRPQAIPNLKYAGKEVWHHYEIQGKGIVRLLA